MSILARSWAVARRWDCRGMHDWAAAVRRWDETYRVVTGGHIGDRFGKHAFWETSYRRGTAPSEWFLSAETAAAATLHAYRAHVRQREPPSLSAINLGCGTSHLGSELIATFDAAATVPTLRKVCNVDYSAAALETLEAAQSDPLPPESLQRDATQAAAVPRQTYRLWDVTAAVADDPTSEFDLLVDKGTLDAVAFAGGESLVGYLRYLRLALRPRGPGPPPLLVHFSDEPPEVREELLRAAFPPEPVEQEGGGRWHVAACAVDEGGGEGGTRKGSLESLFEWTYYRYCVTWDEGR